jgi:hypothetical protein
MTDQLERDAMFYWSICILHQLLENGLLTKGEYTKIWHMSAQYYGTKLLCA